MIQLSGKIDGQYPFSAVTNGSLCSVSTPNGTVTAVTEGFVWMVKFGGPYEVSHQFKGKAHFSWPNPSRQWQARQDAGQAATVTCYQDGFSVDFDFVIPAGQAGAVSGPFGLVGDYDFDGDVDSADLAIALAAGKTGEDLARLLGNWG